MVEIRADLRDIGWIAVKVGATWYPAMANQPGFDGISYDQLREGMRAIRHKYRKDALIDAPTVLRAIERISEANRRAFALRELTPFHVTDAEVERHQAALHYPIRSDAERLGHISPSADPLANGIQISPRKESAAPSQPDVPDDPHATRRERRNRWRFNDDK